MQPKVGDLVKCPAFDGHTAYAGIILGVHGHKVEVLGGTHKSWDGIGPMRYLCLHGQELRVKDSLVRIINRS